MSSSFKTWLLTEDGYIYFDPPINLIIKGSSAKVTAIDLQTQNMARSLRPQGHISLKTGNGWINVVLRDGRGLLFYDFESITKLPLYEPIENWLDSSLIIGKQNIRLDTNIDTNVAV